MFGNGVWHEKCNTGEYLTISIFLEIQKECEKVQPQQGVSIWANTNNSEQSL